MRYKVSSDDDRLMIGSLGVRIPVPLDPRLSQQEGRERAHEEAVALARLLAAAPRMRQLLDRCCRSLEDAAALLTPEAHDCCTAQADAWTIRAQLDDLPPLV